MYAGDTAMVLDAATGATPFSFTDPSGNLFWGPADIGDGVLCVSNNEGNLIAFTVDPAAATPEAPNALMFGAADIDVLGGVAITRRRSRSGPTPT